MFLRPSTKNNAPSANFVSAKNLLGPCPASLLQALHPSNPDRDIWLRSYNEEKGGLEAVDVYEGNDILEEVVITRDKVRKSS